MTREYLTEDPNHPTIRVFAWKDADPVAGTIDRVLDTSVPEKITFAQMEAFIGRERALSVVERFGHAASENVVTETIGDRTWTFALLYPVFQDVHGKWRWVAVDTVGEQVRSVAYDTEDSARGGYTRFMSW